MADPIQIIRTLLDLVPRILDAVSSVGRRISGRPPPPSAPALRKAIGLHEVKKPHELTADELLEEIGIHKEAPSANDADFSPIYKDAHLWTRFGPHLPPQTCIYCKQPITTASQYCPGVMKRKAL